MTLREDRYHRERDEAREEVTRLTRLVGTYKRSLDAAAPEMARLREQVAKLSYELLVDQNVREIERLCIVVATLQEHVPKVYSPMTGLRVNTRQPTMKKNETGGFTMMREIAEALKINYDKLEAQLQAVDVVFEALDRFLRTDNLLDYGDVDEKFRSYQAAQRRRRND